MGTSPQYAPRAMAEWKRRQEANMETPTERHHREWAEGLDKQAQGQTDAADWDNGYPSTSKQIFGFDLT